MTALRALPVDAKPMDALRTAVSAWGATQTAGLAPDRRAGAGPDRVLAVGAGGLRAAARRARSPSSRTRRSTSSRASCTSSTASSPDAATARALDAYFIVGAEHGFNASTFTARVITSTRSDIASAVSGAIGAMKGPLHGGAPSEVVEQIHEVGIPENAEQWVRDDARPRRPADGLRAPRLSRLRPAGRRAAQGRREHGAPARLAASWRSPSRTSRCACSPRSTRSGRSRPTSSTTRRPCSWASA